MYSILIFQTVSSLLIGKYSSFFRGEFNGIGRHGDGCLQLARILQFLECPQYLRKHFFPLHKDLQYAGVLNPTDMPHHLRANEWCEYREGVVLDRPPTKLGSLVRNIFPSLVKLELVTLSHISFLGRITPHFIFTPLMHLEFNEKYYFSLKYSCTLSLILKYM